MPNTAYTDVLAACECLRGDGVDVIRASHLDLTGVDRGRALVALQAGRELTEVMGGYFVTSFPGYKHKELPRFGRFITDWELREYL